MVIKPILLKLTAEETLRLSRILLDDDEKEAYPFLKECLKPKLEEATREH